VHTPAVLFRSVNMEKSKKSVAGSRRDTRRRFEQWVQNPACGANLVSAVHNVKMGAVARRENPLAPKEGQSVFALARGNNFESSLVRDGAKVLLASMHKVGLLKKSEKSFLDFRTSANGGPLADLDEAIKKSEKLLVSLADASTFRGVISSLTLRIPKGVMLPEATLIIDVVCIKDNPEEGTGAIISVGEVKTYPDRGGYTSKSDLAKARAQMGLYVHALELVLEKLGMSASLALSNEGFLILTYPGSNQPRIRMGEDLRFQAERAKRGFELMGESAERMPDIIGAGEDEEDLDMINEVLKAPVAFSDACLSFCERSEACFNRAMADGSGTVLGGEVERFLGGIGLSRVDELLDGAKAKNSAERDFLSQMKSPIVGFS
jgi:hypothetical protein